MSFVFDVHDVTPAEKLEGNGDDWRACKSKRSAETCSELGWKKKKWMIRVCGWTKDSKGQSVQNALVAMTHDQAADYCEKRALGSARVLSWLRM